jgi:hypothetical protein
VNRTLLHGNGGNPEISLAGSISPYPGIARYLEMASKRTNGRFEPLRNVAGNRERIRPECHLLTAPRTSSPSELIPQRHVSSSVMTPYSRALCFVKVRQLTLYSPPVSCKVSLHTYHPYLSTRPTRPAALARQYMRAAITRGMPARSGTMRRSCQPARNVATRSRLPKPSSITSRPPGRRTRGASATICW